MRQYKLDSKAMSYSYCFGTVLHRCSRCEKTMNVSVLGGKERSAACTRQVKCSTQRQVLATTRIGNILLYQHIFESLLGAKNTSSLQETRGLGSRVLMKIAISLLAKDDLQNSNSFRKIKF